MLIQLLNMFLKIRYIGGVICIIINKTPTKTRPATVMRNASCSKSEKEREREHPPIHIKGTFVRELQLCHRHRPKYYIVRIYYIIPSLSDNQIIFCQRVQILVDFLWWTMMSLLFRLLAFFSQWWECGPRLQVSLYMV